MEDVDETTAKWSRVYGLPEVSFCQVQVGENLKEFLKFLAAYFGINIVPELYSLIIMSGYGIWLPLWSDRTDSLMGHGAKWQSGQIPT